jgi:hypothetical protein
VKYTPTGLTVSRGVASSPQTVHFKLGGKHLKLEIRISVVAFEGLYSYSVDSKSPLLAIAGIVLMLSI